MLSYILKRLMVLIPTFLGVTLLTFSLIRLIPGDPVEVMMGERTLDPELHAAALKTRADREPADARNVDKVEGHGRRGVELLGHDLADHRLVEIARRPAQPDDVKRQKGYGCHAIGDDPFRHVFVCPGLSRPDASQP